MRLKDVDHAKFGLGDRTSGLRMAGLWVGEIALRSVFKMFAQAIGLTRFPLPDMDEVAKAGHSHYNQELRGGEGHMEVAKLILNVVKNKAHMTVSVKPFGCMPSSGVSDGVQSVVTSLYPGGDLLRGRDQRRRRASTSTRACRCSCSRRASARSKRWTRRSRSTASRANKRRRSSRRLALRQRAVPRAARGVRLGRGSDPPHRPAGRQEQARASARARGARGAARAATWCTKDAPAVAASARKVAPHLPAVATLGGERRHRHDPGPHQQLAANGQAAGSSRARASRARSSARKNSKLPSWRRRARRPSAPKAQRACKSSRSSARGSGKNRRHETPEHAKRRQSQIQLSLAFPGALGVLWRRNFELPHFLCSPALLSLRVDQLHRADEVHLAEVHAVVAQDRVGGGDVEVEVR